MNWDRLIAVVTMILDGGILAILIKEFNYDKLVYEKEQYKKIKTRKRKFELPEQGLTMEEGK